MTWKYMIPGPSALPAQLADARTSHDPAPDLRLGVYCAADSHANEPWLIGSFAPSYAEAEATGKPAWQFTNRYPMDGGRLVVMGPHGAGQLIADGERVPTDADGLPILNDRAREVGYARVVIECKRCGFRRVYRDANVQRAVAALIHAGLRELPASMLAAAIDRA